MTPAAAQATIDWTPIVLAIVSGVFSVIGIVATTLINSRMKSQQAATSLGNAVKNSLGAVQNAIDDGLTTHPLLTTLPAGTSPQVAAGVQYILNQAGPEMATLGVTPDQVAGKVEAQIGLSRAADPAVPSIPAAPPPPVTPATKP
jgi:hypothetical protein